MKDKDRLKQMLERHAGTDKSKVIRESMIDAREESIQYFINQRAPADIIDPLMETVRAIKRENPDTPAFNDYYQSIMTNMEPYLNLPNAPKQPAKSKFPVFTFGALAISILANIFLYNQTPPSSRELLDNLNKVENQRDGLVRKVASIEAASKKSQEEQQIKYQELQEKLKYGIPKGSEDLYKYVTRFSAKSVQVRPFVSIGNWNKQVKDYTDSLLKDPTKKDYELIERVMKHYISVKLKTDGSRKTVDQIIASYNDQTIHANYLNYSELSEWDKIGKFYEVEKAKINLINHLQKNKNITVKGDWFDLVKHASKLTDPRNFLPEEKRYIVTSILLRETMASQRHSELQTDPIKGGYRILYLRK